MSNPAPRLADAFRALQAGRHAEALAVAESAVAEAPGSVDALHLLALCRKASGNAEGALAAFGAALARAPRDPNLLVNFANLLAKVGRHDDAIAAYRRALDAMPSHAEAWLNLGLALLELRRPAEARTAFERAVSLRPAHAPSWQALGSAHRASGDLESAESALRRAVQADPRAGAAWTNLGVVRRLLGDPADALQCYAAARRAGFKGPQLDDAEASAWLDAGEIARAREAAWQLTRSSPAYVPGHAMLAHIQWEHSAGAAGGDDPRATFRRACESQPANRALGLACARFLIEANDAEGALAVTAQLLAGGAEPELLAARAVATELGGDLEGAGRLFAAAHASLPMDPGFLNLYARHLLKVGDPQAAAARALEALARAPDDQPALAYLGVAWRLLDDPREHWLCDYERLVGEVHVEPPPGYSDDAQFLDALACTLHEMHTARQAPVNQSLRGGSQTSGVLFGRRDPLIAATRDAIAAAIARHVATLPHDATHPFLRRKSPRVRFVGSWSVRLRSGGNHVNHFHQEGWLSSAFYVSLPPVVSSAGDGGYEGCIQFGQPPVELGLALAPRRVIRPRAGWLALFPSYLWHGTVPFEDDVPRLTLAFDAQPLHLSHESGIGRA
jgi:tetratricopeptide (TPR) repeat protein